MALSQKTTPVLKTTAAQKMTSIQKANRRQKARARQIRQKEGLDSKDGTPTTADEISEMAKILPCGSEKEATTEKNMMKKKIDEEELSDKVKLNALAKKTEELQGYVNQLQDAVTIGMFQLRDLKNQIAAATAALATIDE
ncbi:hypothetical protein FHL15_009035 [Xylaria flabelliformis]|uniref:Uncharacterized protein n=1 Tax=Xylaria flabelliformis TaxID=2512241 RepID=A0A553HQ89_9PEZI|nr:hypothetical protein FHL15_009035 [Xylaria flabelliformis]